MVSTGMDEEQQGDISLKNASLYAFDREIIRTPVVESKPDSSSAFRSGKPIASSEIGVPFDFRHVSHCGFDGNFSQPPEEEPISSSGHQSGEPDALEFKLSDIVRSNLVDDYSSKTFFESLQKLEPKSTHARQLSKEQISEPRQFRHLVHIGTLSGSESSPPENMHKVHVDGVDVYFNDESYANLATKIQKAVLVGEEKYIDERRLRALPTENVNERSEAKNDTRTDANQSFKAVETSFQRQIIPNSLKTDERPIPKPRKLRQAPSPPPEEDDTWPGSLIHPSLPEREKERDATSMGKPPVPKPRTKLPAPPPPIEPTLSPTKIIKPSCHTNRVDMNHNGSDKPSDIKNSPFSRPPRLIEGTNIYSRRDQSDSPTPLQEKLGNVFRQNSSVVDEPKSPVLNKAKPPVPPKAKKPPLRPVIFSEKSDYDPEEPSEDANGFQIEPEHDPTGSYFHVIPSVRSLTKRTVHLPPDLPKRLSHEAKYLQNFTEVVSNPLNVQYDETKTNEINRYENVKQVWEEIEMNKHSTYEQSNNGAEQREEPILRQTFPFTATGRIRRTKSLVLDEVANEGNQLDRAKIPVRF